MPTPVPNYPAQARTMDQLYRGLSAGHVCPTSITADECVALKTYCANVVSNLQKNIERSVQRGRYRIARRDQMQLWDGLAARLVAAWKGHRKIDTRKRRRTQASATIIQRSFAQTYDLADRLKNPKAPSVAFLRCKPKPYPKNGYRYFFVFDAFGIAKHCLFVNAVKPFASFHPSQFILRRGRSVACETLLDHMNTVSPDTKFVELDVKDFYMSFCREWVEEYLPAPKAITRNSLFLENWRIVDCGTGYTKGQQGLPPGSAASSFVAEMTMADVLRHADLTGYVCLVVYSDNIGGLLPTEMDAAALVEQLTKSFAEHPAGPFRITSSKPTILSVPFRFLGYWFVKSNLEQARVYIPDDVWQQKEMEFQTEFADAETLDAMLLVCRRFLSYFAAIELAPERLLLARRVITFMHNELEYRERILTGRMSRH